MNRSHHTHVVHAVDRAPMFQCTFGKRDAYFTVEEVDILLSRRKRRKACDNCENCRREDCGSCKNCLDKPKFGGSNVKKQRCVHRVCTNMS